MNSKIKFVVVDGLVTTPLHGMDLDIIDQEDEVEKHILIGLGIELEGKTYTVVNQVVEVDNSKRDLIYYIEEMK